MNIDFIVRIIVCFLLSIAIGIERQYRHKLVGLRTNVLVSLGAFMFNWVTFASLDSDSTRIAAQVVSGIGFLGAGIIMKDGNKVKGLNTAATLWCVAAIGVMTSFGLLLEACIGTLMVLASNIILRFISITIMNRVKNNQRETCILNVNCNKENEDYVRGVLLRFIENNTLNLLSLNKVVKDETVDLKLSIITSRISLVETFVNKMAKEISINAISWEHNKSIIKSEMLEDDDE
jgi:putative Mg2+ transporter-C (MgtC) family protein